MRNGSLCSSIAFEKEVFSHQNDTRLLARNPLFLSGSTDKFVQQGCFFLPSFSCNFDDQFSSNFHRLVILCFNMYGLMLGVGGGGKVDWPPPCPPPPPPEMYLLWVWFYPLYFLFIVWLESQVYSYRILERLWGTFKQNYLNMCMGRVYPDHTDPPPPITISGLVLFGCDYNHRPFSKPHLIVSVDERK